jgi:hypothetical protein
MDLLEYSDGPLIMDVLNPKMTIMKRRRKEYYPVDIKTKPCLKIGLCSVI